MKNAIIAILVLLAGGAAFAAYRRKKEQNQFAAVVEGNPDIAKGKSKPSIKYRKISSEAARAMGRDIARLAGSLATAPAALEAAFGSMLTLQKDSFLEVYWTASEALGAQGDLIKLLEQPRFSTMPAAQRVARTLAVLVKKRYEPTAAPNGLWQSIVSRFNPFRFDGGQLEYFDLETV